MRRLNAFARAENGAISVMTAVSMVALIGFVGLATDVGSVYLESRRLQGAVDLAAIAAAEDPARGNAIATQAVQQNGFASGASVTASSGVYASDRSIAARNRFTANAPRANAVRVEARWNAPLHFARLFVPSGHMTVSRRATAAQARLASFEVGSRLLSLNGGLANNALSALTGSSVSLSVMDYNSLVSADIDLLNYVEALRTRLDLDAATFNETLDARADTPTAIAAIADVLQAQDARASAAMRRIAAASRGSVDGLDNLIDLGPYKNQDVSVRANSARIGVNAMDLATAILELAGGERQVRFQTGANVPGLTSADVWLAIGERPNRSPWITVTESHDVILRTAQMRVYIVANVRAAPPLASVRVPVLVEAASAQARLSDIQCGTTAASRSVTLSVSPSIGTVSLGEINTSQLDNFRTTLTPSQATLVSVAGLANIRGQARVQIGGQQWTDVRFSGADIDRRSIKTVATRDAAQATLSSLLGQTQLNVQALGLGLGVPALTSATRGALTSAGAPLDSLLNGVLDLVGVHLGEADVRVNGARCGGAVLVA